MPAGSHFPDAARRLHHSLPFAAVPGRRNSAAPTANSVGRCIMAHNLKDQINEVGKKVGECMSNTADWVKEKTGMGPGREEGSDAGIGGIRQHMEVLDVGGQKIGTVDRVEGDAI